MARSDFSVSEYAIINNTKMVMIVIGIITMVIILMVLTITRVIMILTIITIRRGLMITIAVMMIMGGFQAQADVNRWCAS